MNKYKNKLTGRTVGALIVCGLSQQASAQLYVSPVVRQTVKIDSFDKKESPEMVAVKEEVTSVSGQSTVHGSFLMREEVEAPNASTMRFGKNVPLFIALEKVVPNSKDWFIHIDDGLDNMAVSWKGGQTWEDVVYAIGAQNNLNIKINNDEHAIGVSKNAELAVLLAKEVPEVWEIKSSLTLRENLAEWAKKAGWSLVWDESLKVDFPVVKGAVLTGKFIGEGGVVDTLLYSMRKNKVPLTAKFHKMNKVLLITEAGYRQEVAN
ncbi:TcpQ domain-containing protein [Psychromonas sp. SP041]|uniref:TcpQ domain-containing protein n=1 Tax=Psychromonas sp. SP041 TaxID=1365007 RepID=UPI0010C79A9D|nr:TcpQ domain-containing protein [Psychromonas sp. SP041]